MKTNCSRIDFSLPTKSAPALACLAVLLLFIGSAAMDKAFGATPEKPATSAATASANTNLVPAAPASAGSITSAKSRVPKGPPSLQSSGWQKLFDGKSLAGWKITDFAGRGMCAWRMARSFWKWG